MRSDPDRPAPPCPAAGRSAGRYGRVDRPKRGPAAATRDRVVRIGLSFGALSEEAKIALAKGAELAGAGICSGEGGMLPEERQANSHYFYELASARFGFSMDKLEAVQAFHIKGGQGRRPEPGAISPGSRSRVRSRRFVA